MNDKEIVKACGGYVARIRAGKLQTQVSVDLRHQLDGPVKEVIKRLAEAAEGVHDPELEVHSYDDYGDPMISANIRGWHDATDAERDKLVQHIEQRRTAQRQRDEQDLAALKARRPDMFQ